MAVVGAARGVVAHERLDGGGAELAAGAGALAQQQVGGDLAQLLAEPAGQRHAEAGLRATGDLRRQIGGEGATQGLLAATAAQAVGQRDAERQHAVVEEGRA